MAESQPIFPLEEVQLVKDVLVTETELLGSILNAEMKLLQGTLAASLQSSPFKPEHIRLPEADKLAPHVYRIFVHSQHLVQDFIGRQLAMTRRGLTLKYPVWNKDWPFLLPAWSE